MVAILRSTAGNGKLVFVERSSALVLNYYLDPGRSAQIGLGRPPQVIATMPAEPFDDFWWGGVHVVSSPSDLWWSPELFFQDVAALGKERDLGKGIYVVNAGLSKPLAPARAFQGQQPVHWLVRNPQKPEMFWMPLGGAQPVGPTH